MTSRCNWCGQTDIYGLDNGLCWKCSNDLYDDEEESEALTEQVIAELKFTQELQRKDAA